jgi:tetratricopeptide (TPR) repeat protein
MSVEPPTEPGPLEQALAELRELKEQVAALSEAPAESAWKTWVAAAGTASVTLLAFLIPSVQDQWDRHTQRADVEEYREVARELMQARKYHDAEQALERAVELSGTARPELERERLQAKTEQVNTDLDWGGKIDDESLEESDFSVLEVMLARAGQHADRAWALNNHAVFLAHHGQTPRAAALLEQAVREAPGDARIRVTLGNVRWDLGDLTAAAQAYAAALQLQPDQATAHYNLGLLREQQGDLPAARRELQRVLALQPGDAAREELERLSDGSPEST